MDTKAHQLRVVADSDGAVILDLERGLVSTLNATGAYIWQALQDGVAIEQITITLSRETDQPIFTVKRDVDEFMRSLELNMLLSQERGEADAR